MTDMTETDVTDKLAIYEKILMDSLGAKMRGEEYDEDEAMEAGTVLAAAALVQRGLSLDAVEKMMTERDYSLSVKYDPSDDMLVVSIDFEDGDDDGED